MSPERVIALDPKAAGDDRRRKRILSAALRYMHRYGSEKLNIVEVARWAKVARATVYNHFGSREGLLEAVFDHLEAEYMGALEADMRRCESFDDQVAAAISFICDSWEKPGQAVWFGFVSPADEPQLLLDRFAENLQTMASSMRKFVVEGQERGELRPDLDPDSAAEWVSRIVLSYSISHSRVPVPSSEEIGEFVRAHLVRGLRA